MSAVSKTPIAVTVLIAGVLGMVGWLRYRDIREQQQRERNSVMGNLRVLSTGADQYYLARGVSSVATTDLLGTNSSQYIRNFATHSNETYPAVLMQGQVITASGIAGARTITYSP